MLITQMRESEYEQKEKGPRGPFRFNAEDELDVVTLAFRFAHAAVGYSPAG